MTPRLWAACALGVLLVALIAYAAVVIPWHRPPAPRADQLDALRALPREQVLRARAFHAELRPGSYGALAVGLLETPPPPVDVPFYPRRRHVA